MIFYVSLLRRSSSSSPLVVTCCFEIPIHQESIILKTLTNYILSSQAFASYLNSNVKKKVVRMSKGVEFIKHTEGTIYKLVTMKK